MALSIVFVVFSPVLSLRAASDFVASDPAERERARR
jgi:hypothetical protein